MISNSFPAFSNAPNASFKSSFVKPAFIIVLILVASLATIGYEIGKA